MSEWGPWIEHDGRGCPCSGKYVHVFNEHGVEWFGVAGSKGGESWDLRCEQWAIQVIRYRVRKPRGLTILQEIIENLPLPTKEQEHA